MDGARARRTRDQVRKAWYASYRQWRFARHYGFQGSPMKASTLVGMSRRAREPMLAAVLVAALAMGADRAVAQVARTSVAVGSRISRATAHRAQAGPDVHRRFLRRDYAGSKDGEYIVHLPAGYAYTSQPLPLVMVLHGCDQDHRTIKHDTNFDAVADEYGFIVVYPFLGTPSRFQDNCWSELSDAHIHRGGGEVQDLREIVEEVRHAYRVDRNRIHITGFSSGGGMAVAAMLAHPQLFASGSVTAGLPYGETPNAASRAGGLPGFFKPVDETVEAMDRELGGERRPVPILIIHSTSDCNIHIRASENLRDAWGRVFGVDMSRPIASQRGVTRRTRWMRWMYGEPAESTIIETLFIKGMPHGWYGGRNGRYAFSNAPDTTRLTYQFFQAHPFNESREDGLAHRGVGSCLPDPLRTARTTLPRSPASHHGQHRRRGFGAAVGDSPGNRSQ